MDDHKFLLADFNKTIKKMDETLKENKRLKSKIKQIEQILNLSTNSLISAKKAGNVLIFKCSNCSQEYLLLGKKVPGKVFTSNCFNCKKEIIINKNPDVIIKM